MATISYYDNLTASMTAVPLTIAGGSTTKRKIGRSIRLVSLSASLETVCADDNICITVYNNGSPTSLSVNFRQYSQYKVSLAEPYITIPNGNYITLVADTTPGTNEVIHAILFFNIAPYKSVNWPGGP